MVDMSSISAVPSLLTLLVQVEENGADSLSMFWLTLVKRHEIHENNMPLMHEEIAEEIPSLLFRYLL